MDTISTRTARAVDVVCAVYTLPAQTHGCQCTRSYVTLNTAKNTPGTPHLATSRISYLATELNWTGLNGTELISTELN